MAATKAKTNKAGTSTTLPTLDDFIDFIESQLRILTRQNRSGAEQFERHEHNLATLRNVAHPLTPTKFKLAIDGLADDQPDRAAELTGILRRVGQFLRRIAKFANQPERLSTEADAVALHRYQVAKGQLDELRDEWAELRTGDLATVAAIAGGKGKADDAPSVRIRRQSKETLMIQTIQKCPESAGWSASKWAEHLGVKSGTVKGYMSWANIMRMRIAEKFRRQEADEGRSPRPKNRRRKTVKAD